jgi:NhaP-type Na+/H+ or K+/H+ antiporter
VSEHLLLGLASIIVLGILAQWLAWRLHLPAILLLLIFGFAAGPVFNILHPDTLFGEVLFPLVSVSVAIILFEGGLNLKFSEVRQTEGVISSLVTIGILVTWILASIGARLFVGMGWETAILIGAILVVTGPTVIIPLLRQVRPAGNVGTIIKWEGIVNDPFGAILAVIVFEVIVAAEIHGGSIILWGALKAFVFGGLIGVAGAVLMVLLLRRYLIPDFLQNPVSLMVVVITYFASDVLQPESGLLAVTVMGVALANQRFVSIRHILEFKENLRVVLISSLFIILAARLPVGEMSFAHIGPWIFVAFLIVIVRPAAVFISTLRSNLKRREKMFLSWMAPRGIVAAAVSSVFGIRLMEGGVEGAELLFPVTFQVIIATVAIYGLTASWVARRLKLAQPNPQGVLLGGAHFWARQIGRVLKDEGFEVAVIDSNWSNITEARRDGCRSYYGSLLAEDMLNRLQLPGIGKFLALTPNEEVNSLAALHFVDIFGRSEVFQLPRPSVDRDAGNKKRTAMPAHLRGRYLFNEEATYDYITSRFRAGAIVKRTPLTDEFDYGDYRDMYGPSAIPLFIITDDGDLRVVTVEDEPNPKPGQTLISIVDPVEKPDREEAKIRQQSGKQESRDG